MFLLVLLERTNTRKQQPKGSEAWLPFVVGLRDTKKKNRSHLGGALSYLHPSNSREKPPEKVFSPLNGNSYPWSFGRNIDQPPFG